MAAAMKKFEAALRRGGAARWHPDALIAQYIALDPARPWAEEAYIRGRGVAVWAIIGYLLGMDGDLVQTADDYELPVDAVQAAVAYYGRHRAAIDARLAPTLAPVTA